MSGRQAASAVVGCVLGAFACSSGQGRGDGGGGSGGGDGGASCVYEDLCAQVTLAQVSAACGVSAAETRYLAFPESIDNSDLCSYGPSGAFVFEITRACFFDGTRARPYYDATHDMMLPGSTREDLSGLGDAAFFRFNAGAMRAQLSVLRENQLIMLDDGQATTEAATKACLTDLAASVLAAH